jgi:hypothetical protein
MMAYLYETAAFSVLVGALTAAAMGDKNTIPGPLSGYFPNANRCK